MTIAAFVGRLAQAGAWFSVEGESVRFHGPRRLLTDGLRAFVDAHREALIALLRKNEDELTDAELGALGFRRREPGARILRDPREPEPRSWTPPPDWGPEGDGA